MPITENVATLEPRRRPRIAVLAFKDHVLTCTDILNVARCWARRGYCADILAYDTGLYPQTGIADEGVRLLLVRTLYGRLLPLVRRLRSDLGVPAGEPQPPRDAPAPDVAKGRPTPGQRLFRAAVLVMRGLQTPEFFLRHTLRLLFGPCSGIIACDTVSLLVARTVNLVRGIPYLYHSRELALSWDSSSLGARAAKWLERRCHRRALCTVIQDRTRAELLGRDNGVPFESFLIVPNAPIGTWENEPSDYLASRLGVPAGAPIVLHAGSVVPETMVLEIIGSIGGWPREAVLVVHGVPETVYLPALEAAAARFPGRVFFSPLLVAAADVDRLFASAAVGLAFYRPSDDNHRCVGHAAGKIFNLMKVGIPIVTNDLPGMRELVEESGCGRVVRDPADLGEAIADLLLRREACRARCAETFPQYEFSHNYRAVIDCVETAIGR